jgi:hypothetical protein
MGSSSGFGGIAVTNQYNNRLQPALLSGSTSGGQVFGLSYNYGSGTSNNGDVQIVTDTVNNARSMAYIYDSVNRLSQAYSYTTYAWGNTYTYDGWVTSLRRP